MKRNNNILQELTELNSTLTKVAVDAPYTLPQGYFDGLVEQVLRRIKALDAVNAADEIAILSPVLSNISRQMPYQVPAGYFAENVENIGFVTSGDGAVEELNKISPLLSGLQKQNPYSLPAGYFEQLTPSAIPESSTAKVVKMGSATKWWKLAAAAVVIGIFVTIGVQFIGSGSTKDPVAKVQKEVKKASDIDLNEVIELIGDNNETATVNIDDTKELLKDIPETELKEFLQDISNDEVETDNPILN